MNSEQILALTVKAADQCRAHRIVALDMSEVSLANYFIIMDASSSRQVRAIANNIIEEMKKRHVDVIEVEGMSEAKWVLIDFGGVIVHVFQRETRSYYNLEKLWSDAKTVDVSRWLDKD